MRLLLVVILAPVTGACGALLGIDDATVILDTTALDATRAPDAGADRSAVSPFDDGPHADASSPEADSDAAAVIDCSEGRCAGGAVCPPGRPCVVHCRGAGACPSVTCAAGQRCVVDCEEGACAAVEVRATGAESACIRCGTCDFDLYPTDGLLGCREPGTSCQSTDSCGL